ncbi:cytochrome P450 monooxygenase pc-1 [Crepidotus variabilis]|uniref:Cytochrome P450 monooxygenase pc-1 n=1 Tax=Crepidotus variabilis TaxID=179855 RepID=A0A9P6EB78_9AGAR|nr:cytochrome P450 monooxygenase pc-1 [Crepidotus variabilis]
MALATPGVRFLTRNSLYLLLSSSLAVYVNNVFFETSNWMFVIGTLLCLPLISTIIVVSTKWSVRRQATAIGARVIPEVRGAWPGNLDILRFMIKKIKTGYPGDGLIDLHVKYGPALNLRVTWSDLVMTTSPEHIKIILATDFHNFVKGERFRHNMEAVLGTGVFNSDGEMWKFHRSITRPVFTRERISHFDLFDQGANKAIDKLKGRLREGHLVDFQDLMWRFTLDSATSFLFGHCVDSLSADLPYPSNTSYPPPQLLTPQGNAANSFARAFAESQEVISFRERYGWIWPLLEITKDKTHEPMKIVKAYIEPIVNEALERKRSTDPEANSKGGEDDETLLDHLVRVTDDPTVLKDEILNIMIAGRDTTASTLTFVIYFLAMYPQVFERLRQEILDKVGQRRPDYDDIREMKYLPTPIAETLRLYPVVPFNIRESINATTLPSEDAQEKPYYLPAGSRIGYSVFLMHRRKDLWGPDAEEFDPDRFLDHRLKTYLTKNPFIFLPFNAGPRICLGQQFAYNEMSFMLIRLLQTFKSINIDVNAVPPEAKPSPDWANETGRKSIEKFFPTMHLTMYTKGGLWVTMKPA